MDGKVLHAAQQLRKQLESLDPQQDRDTLVWSHGFLTGLVKHLESSLPDLMTSKTLLESLRADLDSMLQSKKFDDFDESGDAPVLAPLKPGPRGLIGGAVVPLPDNEPPM